MVGQAISPAAFQSLFWACWDFDFRRRSPELLRQFLTEHFQGKPLAELVAGLSCTDMQLLYLQLGRVRTSEIRRRPLAGTARG